MSADASSRSGAAAAVGARTTEAAATPDWAARPEVGSPWLMRLMFRLSKLFGRRLARGLLPPIALYFWLRNPRVRRDSAAYLRRALGRPVDRLDTFLHVHTFASTLLDRIYFLDGRNDLFDVQAHGVDLLRGVLAHGRGAFLVGAHLGSFEALRALGRSQPGLRVSMAMYEHNARKIMALLHAIDPTLGEDVVALGQVGSMITLSERLARGDCVGILADRTIGDDQTIKVDFLGEPASFPLGVFRMAAVLRCPVVMMTGLYLGRNRYALFFDELADFREIERNRRKAAVEQAARDYAIRLAHYCRMAPYNWFNFFDFWSRPAPTARRRTLLAIGAGLLAWTGAWRGPLDDARAAAPWTLGALLASIARADNARRRFVERRFISALDAPVDASGELRFVKPSRLEKRTLKPRAETMVIDGDRLEIDGAGGRQQLSLRQTPEAVAWVESLRATLSGDRATLERVFEITLGGNESAWKLRLVPRDAQAARALKEVRISGQRGEIDQIDIEQTDGDWSTMRVLR